MNLNRPLPAVIFLLICVITGWLLAETLAPKPVIGLLRLDGGRAIDENEAERLVAALTAAGADDRIAAVVLEIDTPGGAATSSELIQEAILQVRQRKPVVASVTGMATSGGYMIAAAADMILAAPSAEIGNVGAYIMRPGNSSPPAFLFPTGPYKLSGGSRFDQIRQLDVIKQSFAGGVIALRSQAPNPITIDFETLTEGKVYLGREALALGLVDAEGSRPDAVVAAARRAGVSRYDLVELSGYLPLPEPTPTPDSGVPFFAALDRPDTTTILFLDSRFVPDSAWNPLDPPALLPGLSTSP